jgi:hypothetical protein
VGKRSNVADNDIIEQIEQFYRYASECFSTLTLRAPRDTTKTGRPDKNKAGQNKAWAAVGRENCRSSGRLIQGFTPIE